MSLYDPQTMHIELMRNHPRAGAYTGGDFAAWQKQARARLGELLGLPLMIKCSPDVNIEYTRQMDGFVETRFTFAVEPKMRLAAHIWIPDGAKEPLPLVIGLQGHSKGMNITMGRPYDAPIAGDRDFSVLAVKIGYAAMALEQRAFGECGGTPDGPACYIPAMAALMLGRTLLGERVWDIMRAIDVVTSDFKAIDPEKILLMGQSGGGTATIYASAIDTRICASMPSCAFCAYMESIGVQNHCSCNFVPGIMKWFDMGDLTGMIAPRPLVIVNGAQDGIFPLEAANREYKVTEKYYAAAGAPGNCRHVVGPEGHRFYAQPAWEQMHELGFPNKL